MVACEVSLDSARRVLLVCEFKRTIRKSLLMNDFTYPTFINMHSNQEGQIVRRTCCAIAIVQGLGIIRQFNVTCAAPSVCLLLTDAPETRHPGNS